MVGDQPTTACEKILILIFLCIPFFVCMICGAIYFVYPMVNFLLFEFDYKLLVPEIN